MKIQCVSVWVERLNGPTTMKWWWVFVFFLMPLPEAECFKVVCPAHSRELQISGKPWGNWHKHPLGLKDELIRICWSRLPGPLKTMQEFICWLWQHFTQNEEVMTFYIVKVKHALTHKPRGVCLKKHDITTLPSEDGDNEWLSAMTDIMVDAKTLKRRLTEKAKTRTRSRKIITCGLLLSQWNPVSSCVNCYKFRCKDKLK